MVPIQVIIIVGGLAGAYWIGAKAVTGAKKAEHAVASKLHRHRAAPAADAPVPDEKGK